jgi:hypothetical protein
MRSIRAFYLLALLCCAITASAQNTRVDATRLVKPAASANKLFVTDGSTLPAWLDAASFFTAGTGISITGNTIANTAGLPTGTTGQTLRHDGSAWVANSLLFNDGTNIGIGTSAPKGPLTVGGPSGDNILLGKREIMFLGSGIANNAIRNNYGGTKGLWVGNVDCCDTLGATFSAFLKIGGTNESEFFQTLKVPELQITTSAAAGRVLQSNASGLASWVDQWAKEGVVSGLWTDVTRVTVGGQSGSKLTVRNPDSGTSAASNDNYEAIVLRPHAATDNNWAVISSHGASGGIAADVGFRLVNHSSLYSDIVFHTRAADGYNARMWIQSGGNVGVNTETPTQKLDVNGAVRFRGAIYDFTNSSGGTSQTLYHNGSGLQWSSQIENDGTAVGIGGSPVWGFELYTAGAARFDGALLSRGTGTASVLSSPTLRLWNTTASTGQLWYLNSADNGNLFLDSDNTGTALAIDGTTGATTIYGELTLPSMSASAATGVLGRTSTGAATTISIGGGLSLSGGTLSATGGGGTNYQTLRYDGTGMTQRAAANFVSTGTVAMALTDDAGNGETEIRATIPTGAVGDTELASTGVTAATYTNATVNIDVDGRVISAANGVPTVVTATSLTADADNLSASGNLSVLRVSGDNGIRAISSISATGMPDGQTFRIVNVGTQPLVLQAQHPDATAGNEFLSPKDVFLPAGQTVSAVRDGTAGGFWLDGAQAQSGRLLTSTSVAGSATAADWGTLTQSANSGAIANGAVDANGHYFWSLATQAVATAAPTISVGKGSAPARTGDCYLYHRSMVRIPTLSDASNTFEVVSGFSTNTTPTGGSSNSARIAYKHDTNGGRWYGYTSDNSTANTVDLGITVATNTVYILEVYLNKQSTEARFFVDGVYRGRSTANTPVTGAVAFPQAAIIKSVGTTARSLYLSEISATYLYPN